MQLIVYDNIFRLLLEVISDLQINMFSIFSRRDSGILLGVISIYKSMFSCFFSRRDSGILLGVISNLQINV